MKNCGGSAEVNRGGGGTNRLVSENIDFFADDLERLQPRPTRTEFFLQGKEPKRNQYELRCGICYLHHVLAFFHRGAGHGVHLPRMHPPKKKPHAGLACGLDRTSFDPLRGSMP